MLKAIAFVDSQHGWIAGEHTIVATVDGGASWTRQYDGPADITSLDFVNTQAGWALAADRLLRTTDGGQSWQEASEPPFALERIDLVTATNGYGVAQGGLFSTTDAGDTWQAVATPIPVGDACFVSLEHGWIANRGFYTTGDVSPGWTPGMPPARDDRVAVFETRDSGRTWQQGARLADETQDESLGESAHRMRCVAPSTLWDLLLGSGYAGGVGYALLHSASGGQQWDEVLYNPGMPDQAPGPTPGDLVAADASTAYLTGLCGPCWPPPAIHPAVGIGRTTDGGATWDVFPVPGLPPVATRISFPTADQGWLVAQVNEGGTSLSVVLATSDGGRTWVGLEVAPAE